MTHIHAANHWLCTVSKVRSYYVTSAFGFLHQSILGIEITKEIDLEVSSHKRSYTNDRQAYCRLLHASRQTLLPSFGAGLGTRLGHEMCKIAEWANIDCNFCTLCCALFSLGEPIVHVRIYMCS